MSASYDFADFYRDENMDAIHVQMANATVANVTGVLAQATVIDTILPLTPIVIMFIVVFAYTGTFRRVNRILLPICIATVIGIVLLSSLNLNPTQTNNTPQYVVTHDNYGCTITTHTDRDTHLLTVDKKCPDGWNVTKKDFDPFVDVKKNESSDSSGSRWVWKN